MGVVLSMGVIILKTVVWELYIINALQVVTAKVVSMGISGENSSQESSSDSSPGSPSHHHQHHHHHHHPVIGPNHEAENLLPSVVGHCLSPCVCVSPRVCVCISVCVCVREHKHKH